MNFLLKTIVAFCIGLSVLYANPPTNFQQAKIIAKRLFGDHQQTLYCNCHYNEQFQIDLPSCQMEGASEKKRALRVEFEHMTPAENFGRQLPCWREELCSHNGKPYKGRRCCAKIDARFRAMEAELYNLWPAVGLVNQVRSNYRYAIVGSNEGFYGCSIQIDKIGKRVEPDERIKGLVARASLFMAQFYDVKLSAAQRQLFMAWDTQFPPDEWEKEWGRRVAESEGYTNSFIVRHG